MDFFDTMNFSKKIPTTTNPVIQLFHADSMLSRDQPPWTAEDLYREYLKRHPATPSYGSDHTGGTTLRMYAKRKVSFFC